MSTDTQNPQSPHAIESVEEMIAHSIALEMEAVERYEEIADAMETHNNPETAELLRRLADYGRKHAAEMKERAGGRDLPRIAPWDYKWGTEESPESAEMEHAHYLMTPYHAVMIAHRAESNAHGFYAGVASSSTNEDVCALAREFAEEEAEHVAILEEWIDRMCPPEEGWDEDLDPPNISE